MGVDPGHLDTLNGHLGSSFSPFGLQSKKKNKPTLNEHKPPTSSHHTLHTFETILAAGVGCQLGGQVYFRSLSVDTPELFFHFLGVDECFVCLFSGDGPPVIKKS